MTSGYIEDWSLEISNNQTSPNYSDSNPFEISSTLLLLIVIALCAVIILLVLLLLLFICRRSLRRKSKNVSNVQVVFVSKATSVTGLNEAGNNNVGNEKVSTVVKCMGSKPSVTNASKDQIHKTLHNKIKTYHPNEKDYQMDPNANPEECSSLLYSEESVSQSAISGATHKSEIANQSSLHGTANEVNILPNTEKLAEYLKDDLQDRSDKDKMLPNDCPPSTSELNLNTANSSLPMDPHVPPKAWFVPLDEIYREPLRHSYINMSNHNYLASVQANKELSSEEKKSLCSNKNSGLRLNCTTSSNSQEAVGEYLEERNCENGGSWRDSGIPNSQSNLGRFNSNDLDKKPSLWDQREDRPVVFLGNADKPSSPTLKSENTLS